MRIAVCDDDALCRAQMLDMLQAYSSERIHHAISYSIYETADELLEAAQRLNGFDIYLLDVLMPDMNGIALGKRLREGGHSGKIIYLSFSTEYAIDAYSVEAFNYLVKPVEKTSFFAALDRAIDAVSTCKEKSLIVKTNESSMRLCFDSILFAELRQRAVAYHLTNGRVVESRQIRTTFSTAVQELLQDERFALCGASLAANLDQIVMVEKDSLLFKDGSKVYIPRKVSPEVRARWCRFWFGADAEE